MEKNKVMGELLYRDERYRIQGWIFEVRGFSIIERQRG
jgi:hypothetical protein